MKVVSAVLKISDVNDPGKNSMRLALSTGDKKTPIVLDIDLQNGVIVLLPDELKGTKIYMALEEVISILRERRREFEEARGRKYFGSLSKLTEQKPELMGNEQEKLGMVEGYRKAEKGDNVNSREENQEMDEVVVKRCITNINSYFRNIYSASFWIAEEDWKILREELSKWLRARREKRK